MTARLVTSPCSGTPVRSGTESGAWDVPGG